MPYKCSQCKNRHEFYNSNICNKCKDNSNFKIDDKETTNEEMNTCSNCLYKMDNNRNFKYEPLDVIKCCLCKFYETDKEHLEQQFERCKNPMNCKNFESRIHIDNKKRGNNMSVNAEEFKTLVDRFNILNEEITELETKIKEYNKKLLAEKEGKVDVLSKYKKDLDKGCNFYLDSDSEVDCGDCGFEEGAFNPYNVYVTDKIANQSAKIKKFNDLLLAYKYCYDKDYKSDWSDGSGKYIIYYDTNSEIYDVDAWFWSAYNAVIFGNKGVAYNCAKWLNDIDPKGELLK